MINNNFKTPAYIFDLAKLKKTLEFHKDLSKKTGCKLLYSIKACCVPEILQYIQKYVDGFSVSSLFEANLAQNILEKNQSIHITTPGFRPDEISQISEICNFIAFNSCQQYERFNNNIVQSNVGIRLNPQISSNINDKYNPCSLNSKLGVPINQFAEYIKNNSTQNISGIHFHTTCDFTDFTYLAKVVSHIEEELGDFLNKIKWINLGGGYLYQKSENINIFLSIIKKLTDKYNLTVYIEPGTSIIQNSCSLISQVIDLFEINQAKIAITDTSVNHLPEVLEFGNRVDIKNTVQNSNYKYLIAGSSCLAGDKFGEYNFEKELTIGTKIEIQNIGAYSIVKANKFNGIDIPDIYISDEHGNLNHVNSL